MDTFTLVSFGHLLLKVCLMGGVAIGVVALGERALGFDVKNLIDQVEKQAELGNVWPSVALMLGGLAALAYFLA